MKQIQKIALLLIISLTFIPNVMAASKYTIKFDANGGKGTTTKVTCKVNKKCKLTKNEFTKKGYTFNGWNTKKDGTGKTYNDEVKNLAKKGTVKLYATWKVNKYTIKFDGNGSTSGSTVKISTKYDKKVTLTKNGYKRKGYTFKGWNTKADGTGKEYLDEAKVKNLAKKGTVTLYAEWKFENWIVNVCSPDDCISVKVKNKKTINLPIINVPEGYEIKYWIDGSTGEKFDLNTKIDNDYTIIAVYGKKNDEIDEIIEDRVWQAPDISIVDRNGVVIEEFPWDKEGSRIYYDTIYNRVDNKYLIKISGSNKITSTKKYGYKIGWDGEPKISEIKFSDTFSSDTFEISSFPNDTTIYFYAIDSNLNISNASTLIIKDSSFHFIDEGGFDIHGNSNIGDVLKVNKSDNELVLRFSGENYGNVTCTSSDENVLSLRLEKTYIYASLNNKGKATIRCKSSTTWRSNDKLDVIVE